MLPIGIALVAASAPAETAERHVISVTEPVLEPEDGLLLGNGDLSVSVYQTRDRIIFRFGKGDVWDRRFDRSDDPRPPHIEEIARGIAVEGWKCSPYGDGEPVALHGTNNPERMKELCKGSPPSYRNRPYPCPKPVGELALQLPPDLPGLSVRQELTIEDAILRITCTWATGVELRLRCSIDPELNVLVVQWELEGWTDDTRTGHTQPPVWFSLYRWPDPPIDEFAQRFQAEYRHGAFLSADPAKCTPLDRPTAYTVDGRAIIEQRFPPDLTFPQGFRYQLVPFAKEAGIAGMESSATREARLHIMPPVEATNGWVAVAVPSESDAGGADAERMRIAGMLADDADGVLATWEQGARQAAAEFWSHSSLRVADPLIENLWYETVHARRCTTRVGKIPPGLFLPSTVRDYSHWHGDYHTNYNYQQPFWADYTANQTEVGDAYFTGMQYLVDTGRIIAERHYGTRGTFIQLTGYPMKLDDDSLGAVPMGRMAYMTGWAANMYWWRYLYTRDAPWLREVGYPVLRDCALFYTDLMKRGEDGLYHVFPSNQGEDGFTGDPKDYTDRGQVMRHMRYCLRSAIEASEVLSVDEALRGEWRERLNNAAGDDGQAPVELEGTERHFAEANPPEFGRGVPYAGPVADTDEPAWPGAGNWTDLWYAGQYPVMAMQHVRAGVLAPDRAYEGLRRIVERWRHPNGLIWAMALMDYGHAGAWTETLGICAPLQEMMLQSYGGVLRIFPVWPLDVAASFTTFRAEGAFLVSASCAEGGVTRVEVHSERGGACRLYSPWTEGVSVETADGRSVAVARPPDGMYAFDTEAGESYRLSPP